MLPRSGNRELMRDINRHLVLNLIKNRGPVSRTDVAALSGLAQGTITNITRDLLEAGIVREVASGPSTGGRRPILLQIDPAGGYALGVKLTPGREFVLALTDLDGNVSQSQVVSACDPAQVERYVDCLESAAQGFLAGAGVDEARLIGIGVGLPGFVDHANGICRHSALLGWHDVPLRALLESRFAAPVVLDNDVNTLTLYEALFGRGRGLSDFVVVTIGSGVGMGAYVNGAMLRGAGGGAGEFGHIPVAPDGPVCNCGNRGCLEALVSNGALVEQARAAGLPVRVVDDLLRLTQAGEPAARAIYARAGAWFGRGLAVLVNVFNPSHVIFSGEGAKAIAFLLPSL
ncbi:MAG TPA: ROK family transcriptional regulator, partial [Anaerolineae bacterium]